MNIISKNTIICKMCDTCGKKTGNMKLVVKKDYKTKTKQNIYFCLKCIMCDGCKNIENNQLYWQSEDILNRKHFCCDNEKCPIEKYCDPVTYFGEYDEGDGDDNVIIPTCFKTLVENTINKYADWIIEDEGIIDSVYIKELKSRVYFHETKNNIKYIITDRIEHPGFLSKEMMPDKICPGCYLINYAKIPSKFVSFS